MSRSDLEMWRRCGRAYSTYCASCTMVPLSTFTHFLRPTYRSRLTAHDLPLTTYGSLLTAPLLTAHYLPLTTYRSLLIAHYLSLTTYRSLLTTHHLPLTTHCSLPTDCSPFPTQVRPELGHATNAAIFVGRRELTKVGTSMLRGGCPARKDTSLLTKGIPNTNGCRVVK